MLAIFSNAEPKCALSNKREQTVLAAANPSVKSKYQVKRKSDINIRWLNMEQVKYCSLLFTSHTGCLWMRNPSLSPQTTQASRPIVWNSTLCSQGVWLTPTVHKSKQHIKGSHTECLQVTGQREVRGQSRAGRAAALSGKGETRQIKSWVAERVILIIDPSSTSAEIKLLPFKTK